MKQKLFGFRQQQAEKLHKEYVQATGEYWQECNKRNKGKRGTDFRYNIREKKAEAEKGFWEYEELRKYKAQVHATTHI